MSKSPAAEKSVSTYGKFPIMDDSAVTAGLASRRGCASTRNKKLSSNPKSGRDAAYSAFAKRLEQACDSLGHEVPPLNRGRLGWFQDKVEAVTDSRPTAETVRRWLGGMMMPRQNALEALAQVLQVDASWLMFGTEAEKTQAERKVRSDEAEGIVNVLAGVIQIDGGHPAFPEPGEIPDLFAIIRGARYNFKVVLAEAADNGTYRFLLPPKVDGLVLIGAVRTAPHNFAFYEIPPERVADEGKRSATTVTLTTELSSLTQIQSFGQRL